jgi:hypothetical protein
VTNKKSNSSSSAKKPAPAPAAKAKPLGQATAASILGKAATKSKDADPAARIKPEWQKYYKNLLDLR